jgi:pimeloyl-ACP methyl ester carboxylesterase
MSHLPFASDYVYLPRSIMLLLVHYPSKRAPTRISDSVRARRRHPYGYVRRALSRDRLALVTIDGAGRAVHRTGPAEFLAAVQPFLRRILATSAT